MHAPEMEILNYSDDGPFRAVQTEPRPDNRPAEMQLRYRRFIEDIILIVGQIAGAEPVTSGHM
jgi:hypothetical protein